ncbi:MAG: flagellin [Pseudomonadota bacterium]
MALTINTNVASINAQRNLTQSQGALNQSLQRLSTGLRINSAKDDAAGLAISERFTTQIRGLNQAARNANDGISLAQTSESALSEVSNNLQRIRELAIQSVNATNSASDRAALNNEVQQRLDEIDRIATQTSFNGLKTLDGSFGTASFQVGANVGETIGVSLARGVRTDQIGQIATRTGVAVDGNGFAAGDFTIAVGNGAAVEIGAAGGSAQDAVDAINAASVPGLTASASNSVTSVVGNVGGTALDTYDLTINSVNIFSGEDVAVAITASDIATQINLFSSQTGVSASESGGSITLTAVDGRNIEIAEAGTGIAAADGFAAAETGVNRGTITLSASENITIDNSGGGAFAELGFADGVVTLDAQTLNGASVADLDGANNVIQRVDASLTTVSTLRSEFGALQSRFESTITNLQTVSESLTASRGRIRDADFAAETANLTKNQILQQAGVSILAQANQQPQLALSLLG